MVWLEHIHQGRDRVVPTFPHKAASSVVDALLMVNKTDSSVFGGLGRRNKDPIESYQKTSSRQ